MLKLLYYARVVHGIGGNPAQLETQMRIEDCLHVEPYPEVHSFRNDIILGIRASDKWLRKNLVLNGNYDAHFGKVYGCGVEELGEDLEGAQDADEFCWNSEKANNVSHSGRKCRDGVGGRGGSREQVGDVGAAESRLGKAACATENVCSCSTVSIFERMVLL